MSIVGSITGREYGKFVESTTRPGQPAVEVAGNVSTTPGPFDPPANCDSIVRSVLSNVETYEYKLGATVLKTVTVTYTAPNLKDLVSVVVT